MKGVFILITLSWHAGCTNPSLFPSSYVKLLDMGSNFRQCWGFNSSEKTACQGHSIMGMYFNQSINPFFYCFSMETSENIQPQSSLNLGFDSHSCMTFCESNQRNISIGFWILCNSLCHFGTLCWRDAGGVTVWVVLATHQLASSRRPVSKGATRKTAKLTERLE